MVEQCREPFLFVLPRSSRTPSNPCDIRFPLCVGGVLGSMFVLLSHRPSLHHLRRLRLRRLCSAASQLYADVRLLADVHARIVLWLPVPIWLPVGPDTGEVSRFSRVSFLDVLLALG